MISLRGLSKPQYQFRPSQIAKRLAQEVRSQHAGGKVRLPWGLDITLDPSDTVSDAIFRQGVYDIATTEVLWRLTSPGDRTVDIGANIGYMTSVLAIRAGARGSVIAFEPHPSSFEILKSNVEGWNSRGKCAPIAATQAALSNNDGTAILEMPDTNNVNVSHARVGTQRGAGIQVPARRFSSYFASPREIALVKIDTEGHEAAVLEGMAGYLGRVRDIIYEEFSPYPAGCHSALECAGYTLFGLEESLLGPKLRAAADGSRAKRSYDTLPSYVATLDAARVKRLLAPGRWRCLTGS